MAKIVRRRNKPGTSPGLLTFIGEKKSEETLITSISYNDSFVDEKSHDSVADAIGTIGDSHISWINIDGLHDVSIIETIGTHLGIHPLVLEDIVHTTQRPKVEIYDDHIYVVMKMITFGERSNEAEVEQVSLILGKGWVISFQERQGDVFDPVRIRLRPPGARIRKMGADYLLYALLDVIVDFYFVALEKIGDVMDDLEDEITYEPTKVTPLKLRDVKHNLIRIRRSTWPVRELLSQLERDESRLISKQTRPFIRDAYDHAVQVIDIVESLRDVLGSLMDLYMTGVSNRMNDIMKVLTIIGTIFIPLTFIAGIYGMNFENMPELHTQNGYFISLGVMAVIAVVLLLFFRKKDWI